MVQLDHDEEVVPKAWDVRNEEDGCRKECPALIGRANRCRSCNIEEGTEKHRFFHWHGRKSRTRSEMVRGNANKGRTSEGGLE